MKRISFIAISGVLMFSASAALAAYDFTGPTQGPTGGNTPGVIWNVDGTSVTQPNAKINIGQPGKIHEVLGDIRLSDTSAFRVDKSGASTFNIGNWFSGQQPFTFGVYGDIKMYSFAPGGTGRSGRMDAVEYCINGSSCITSWPSSGGGGTISSIAVGSGLTVTNPTGPTATIGLSSSCAAGQILKWNGASWACAADTDTNSGGTLTGITAGTGATISGGAPSPTINVTDLYVNTAGDTMTGNLNMSNAYVYSYNPGGYGLFAQGGSRGGYFRGSGVNAYSLDVFLGNDVTNGKGVNIDASTALGTSYGLQVFGPSAGPAAYFRDAGGNRAVEVANPSTGYALSVTGNVRLGSITDKTTVSGTLELIAPTTKLCLGTSGGLPDCRTSWPTSGTPGGSNTQIQYNNGGTFNGSANLTWDNANSRLTLNGYTYFKGGGSTGWNTHLPYGDGKNYIRGTTTIADGGTAERVNIGTSADSSPTSKMRVYTNANNETAARFESLGTYTVPQSDPAGVTAVFANGTTFGVYSKSGYVAGRYINPNNSSADLASPGQGIIAESYISSYGGMFKSYNAPGGTSLSEFDAAGPNYSFVGITKPGALYGASTYLQVSPTLVSPASKATIYPSGQIETIGSINGYYFNDRTVVGQQWALYSDSNWAYLWNGSNRLGISNTGNTYIPGYLGIGTSAPGQKLDIIGGYGRVQTGYSWLTNSDIRYKKNISTLENTLEKISRLRGVRYDLKEDNNCLAGEPKHIGFIAQELEKEYPEMVVTDDNGYKSVAYDKMTAVLTQGVKELKAENDKLKTQNESLEWRLRVLEAKMDALMK